MGTREGLLGRLEKVELRDVWTSEPGDFTPWLAREENLNLLGETLGLQLELEAQEKDVGPFRADVLARDIATESWVLIENQLERTDHTHLGQLMTYAAGLDAVTIVWVAARFTEEHRAALDWLNDVTRTEFRFFGLEIELWRIGESSPAPKFNLASKPNDWTKVVRTKTGGGSDSLTPAKQLQVDFWEAFNRYASEHAQRFRPTRALPQNWMNIAIGRSGFQLSAIASMWDNESNSYGSHEIRAEFVVNHEDSKGYFRALEKRREEFYSRVGQPLTWYSVEGVRACRAYLRKSVNLEDRKRWPEYFAWLTEKLDQLHQAFAADVRVLEPEPAEELETE